MGQLSGKTVSVLCESGMTNKFFINRRLGERRSAPEQRENPRLDLPHKRRRKKTERRREDGTMSEDFYAVHGMEIDDFQASGNKH